MTDAERQQALDAIAAEIATCTKCRLHETRTRAVPGEGSAETEVVFVGEGPGFNEDRQGRPFVGQAGALLTELLASVGWARDEVFITNVVKCRPPGNRDPEPDEMAACAPYLSRQLAALDPALVVTLGRFSMGRFMPGARIGGVHGTYREADAGSGAPEALAFAMYHPAAALHQGSLKETLFTDMGGVPNALVAARRRRAEAATRAEPELGEPANGTAGERPMAEAGPDSAAGAEPEAAIEAEGAVRFEPEAGLEAGPEGRADGESESEAAAQGEPGSLAESGPAAAAQAQPEAAAAAEPEAAAPPDPGHDPETPAVRAEMQDVSPADSADEPAFAITVPGTSSFAELPFPVPATDEPDPQLTLF